MFETEPKAFVAAMSNPLRVSTAMGRLLLAIVSSLFVASCAAITTVSYDAQPGRVGDPTAELTALLEANVEEGCQAKAQVTESMLIFKVLCTTAGVSSAAVHLKNVEVIALQKVFDSFRVVIVEKGQPRGVAFSARTLEDAELMVDAFTALSSPHAATAAYPDD